MENETFSKEYYENRSILPEHLVQTIINVLKNNKVRSVIEAGCGIGFLTSRLKTEGFKVYGFDISFYAAKQAGQVNASATRLPFKDQSVDALIAVSLFEHLNKGDGRIFSKEIMRVLKDGGIVFLVTPNKHSLKSIIFGTKHLYENDPTHIYFYSPRSLSAQLKKSNFVNTHACFDFPRNCTLLGWSLPMAMQKTESRLIRNLVNWTLISSPFGLIRDSFWICAKKAQK
jgi:SAM-dependent methyltransferase